MKSLKTLTATAAIATATGLALPAHAADLLPPAPMIESAPEVGVTELGTGWYLRGDVGYIDYSKPGQKPYGSSGVPFDRVTLDDTWSAGAGFGYKFTNWFRADLTADYFGKTNFDAISSASRFQHGYSRDQAKLEAVTVMANGYLDLGNWYGFTPYVGAGIGWAQTRFLQYSAQVVCFDVSCGPPNALDGSYPSAQPSTYTPSGTRNHLAWALMGGVAVDVGAGFKIDVGYRYLNIGDARTKLDTWGVGTRTKDLEAHEVRVGFRYMID